jgi:hypothetical protein
MFYTSQGLMTAADHADHLKDTDQGMTEIELTGGMVPRWFDAGRPCPVCPESLWNHDAVRVTDASGEVYACYDGVIWRGGRWPCAA